MCEEWSPQTAQLRDGETRDDHGHSNSVVEQLRATATDESASAESREFARERLRERGEEVPGEATVSSEGDVVGGEPSP